MEPKREDLSGIEMIAGLCVLLWGVSVIKLYSSIDPVGAVFAAVTGIFYISFGRAVKETKELNFLYGWNDNSVVQALARIPFFMFVFFGPGAMRLYEEINLEGKDQSYILGVASAFIIGISYAIYLKGYKPEPRNFE